MIIWNKELRKENGVLCSKKNGKVLLLDIFGNKECEIYSVKLPN